MPVFLNADDALISRRRSWRLLGAKREDSPDVDSVVAQISSPMCGRVAMTLCIELTEAV